MSSDLEAIFFSVLGGIVPALLWLWFFLREDKRHPEPKWLLVLAFFAGMIAVYIVLPLEQVALEHASGTLLIVLWATIEEGVKYLAALGIVLWRKAVDEPLDTIIYMVTLALGFAASETILFLLEPFGKHALAEGVLTGNLRFIGASLLHTLSSGIIGFAMAYSFYMKPLRRIAYLYTGLVCAIVLHSLFNFFILKSDGKDTAIVFFFVWLGIIAFFLLFEKAKRITRPLTSK